jgi:hypothetical protein
MTDSPSGRAGIRDDLRALLTPPFVLSLIGIVFAAGVAFSDMRRAAIVTRLERDVSQLEIDRRRLDDERERLALRLARTELILQLRIETSGSGATIP